MKHKLTGIMTSLGLLAFGAQHVDAANPKIYINSEVTTHIVMPEGIKIVDISTDKVLGDKCTDNIVRIKPRLDEDGKYAEYMNGEHMATVTVIGERHIAQYDLEFVLNPQEAQSIYEVGYHEAQQYTNPEVAMPREEMARYAWAVLGERRHYNNVTAKANGMKAQVNNIYAVGDYFFIDYTIENKTRIPYDIAEVRVKLTDKKEVKATNSQTTELSPVFSLNPEKKFKKKTRNVLVLDKLTFPEEKVLLLEVSENQISGRVIRLEIDYSDILHADSFDLTKLKTLKGGHYYKYATPRPEVSNAVSLEDYNKVCRERDELLDDLEELQGELTQITADYQVIQSAYQQLTSTITGANQASGQASRMSARVDKILTEKGRKKDQSNTNLRAEK